MSTYIEEMEARDRRIIGGICMIVAGFILAGVVIYLIAGVVFGPFLSYEDRIERRYDITVVEVRNMKYGGGYVVYQGTDGQLCTANMAENDTLITTGCEAP